VKRADFIATVRALQARLADNQDAIRADMYASGILDEITGDIQGLENISVIKPTLLEGD
jgi:hypothetical protein